MISSHVVTTEGSMIDASKVAPNAFRRLRELFQRGEINIGAHSVAHLNVEEYRQSRRIIPQEFLSFNKDETWSSPIAETLAYRDIWKRPPWFVAPAWGYKDGLTKPEASRLFNYIADSNQHLQQSDGRELFGTIRNGCVSLFETWRSGMSGIKMEDEDLFHAFLDVGIPVHLMLHSAFNQDPLTRSQKIILLACFSLTLLIGNFWLSRYCGPWLCFVNFSILWRCGWVFQSPPYLNVPSINFFPFWIW